MTFDSQGDLFVGDDDGDIYEYAPNGTRTTYASGIGAAVDGLTFDAAGNLYAADWNSQILKFAPNGSSTVFASFSTTELPTGLVYDFGTGDLYMTEVFYGISSPGQQSVFAFSPTGAQSTFASGLYLPYGIADLQSAATPEPGSFVLLAGALVPIGLRRRLRWG
jgi:outer membrane protein assembly factor BamB